MYVCVDPLPTWIALGYSVDVGSVEDTNTCASLILHAHAHTETQSGQADHQEHHAKDDARNCSAPEMNTHKVGFISKSLQSQENDAAILTAEGRSCVESKQSKVSKVERGFWDVERQLVRELTLFTYLFELQHDP